MREIQVETHIICSSCIIGGMTWEATIAAGIFVEGRLELCWVSIFIHIHMYCMYVCMYAKLWGPPPSPSGDAHGMISCLEVARRASRLIVIQVSTNKTLLATVGPERVTNLDEPHLGPRPHTCSCKRAAVGSKSTWERTRLWNGSSSRSLVFFFLSRLDDPRSIRGVRPWGETHHRGTPARWLPG